jgi:hypothetical protein
VAAVAEVEGGIDWVECEWGLVLAGWRAADRGRVLVLKERPLQRKLELLFSKNLYVVALNMALAEQVRRLARWPGQGLGFRV